MYLFEAFVLSDIKKKQLNFCARYFVLKLTNKRRQKSFDKLHIQYHKNYLNCSIVMLKRTNTMASAERNVL